MDIRCLFVVVCAAVCVLAQQQDKYQVRYFSDCASAGLCCEQVNNTCYVPNARKMDGSIGNCFCDSKCMQMGDCCYDFRQTCKARDCEMSEWSAWSDCNNPCGRGSKTRKRSIIQDAAFGGKPCGMARKQKSMCFGEVGCIQNSVEYSREEMKEVGYIMPANFSHFRVSKHYSPQHDIRKNLFFKNFHDNAIPRRPVYAATYRVTHAGRACQNNGDAEWAAVMEKGAEVCVECQPTSMNKRLERCRGHGVFNQETTWKAIEAKNCHGKWKMITHHEPRTCNHNGDHDFVLV